MEYVVITWPDSQDLFEQTWFNECRLLNSDDDIELYGYNAYQVPKKRYLEMVNKDSKYDKQSL